MQVVVNRGRNVLLGDRLCAEGEVLSVSAGEGKRLLTLGAVSALTGGAGREPGAQDSTGGGGQSLPPFVSHDEDESENEPEKAAGEEKPAAGRRGGKGGKKE